MWAGDERVRSGRAPQVDPLFRRTRIVAARPSQRAVSDGVTWRQMIAVVLFSAIATAALLTVAHVRTSQVTAGAGSAVVTEVRDGETPAALAVRVDPDAPVDVTLARIAEMNDLDAGDLTSRHRLLVPAPDRG